MPHLSKEIASDILEVEQRRNVENKIPTGKQRATILGGGRREDPQYSPNLISSVSLRKCTPGHQKLPENVAVATVGQQARINPSIIKPEFKISG